MTCKFNSVLILCWVSLYVLQFLHWKRGLVLHSQPRCHWTHQGIRSIQQLLRRREFPLLLFSFIFLCHAYPQQPQGKKNIKRCVCACVCVRFRPEIVWICLSERKLPHSFQSHKWWCAWTAPQISASLFVDTTVTAAGEWVTCIGNTVPSSMILQYQTDRMQTKPVPLTETWVCWKFSFCDLTCVLFNADCLSKLLQEQISTEIHERPHGQSVWSLFQRAKEERWGNCFYQSVFLTAHKCQCCSSSYNQ